MIHWQKFSDVARIVVLGAKREADARCTAVGPEHLLLTLLTLPQGGGKFLRTHDIVAQQWRAQLPPLELLASQQLLFANGTDGEAISPSTLALQKPISLKLTFVQWDKIPLTEHGKKVLELADEEAMRYGSPSIDSHHILLALLRARDEFAGRWLEDRDITYQTIRTATLQSLYRESPLLYQDYLLAPEDAPSAKLNIISFLLTTVCWIFPILSGGNFFGTSPVLTVLFSLPLIAICVALVVMLFSKSNRLKSAGYWFAGGFIVTELLLSVFTGFLLSIISQLLTFFH